MSFKAEIKTIGLHSRPLLVVASRRVIQFLQHSTTSSQNIFTMHEISRALHQTHGLVLGAAVGLGFGLSLSYYLARQQRARHAIHSKSPEAELVGQVYAERGKATTTVYIVGKRSNHLGACVSRATGRCGPRSCRFNIFARLSPFAKSRCCAA